MEHLNSLSVESETGPRAELRATAEAGMGAQEVGARVPLSLVESLGGAPEV